MSRIRVITAKFPSTLAVLVTASVGVALAVGIASPAGAATSTRVTEGQAQAVFQSQLTGGSAVRDTPAVPHAAPVADEVKPVVMSPVRSGPDDPLSTDTVNRAPPSRSGWTVPNSPSPEPRSSPG